MFGGRIDNVRGIDVGAARLHISSDACAFYSHRAQVLF